MYPVFRDSKTAIIQNHVRALRMPLPVVIVVDWCNEMPHLKTNDYFLPWLKRFYLSSFQPGHGVWGRKTSNNRPTAPPLSICRFYAKMLRISCWQQSAYQTWDFGEAHESQTFCILGPNGTSMQRITVEGGIIYVCHVQYGG